MSEISELIKAALLPEHGQPLFKGDLPGHEFHGNQYSGGNGSAHENTGYNHASGHEGTTGYAPGNRVAGGTARTEYDKGFMRGMSDRHEATAKDRAQLAWLNQPKATRGQRPE